MSTTPGTILKTRYSVNNGAPGTNVLARGEQAYSFKSDSASGGNRLYIGALDGSDIVPVVIGGTYFTDMMDHSLGTLTASSAILVNANSWVDHLITGGLKLETNGGSSTEVTSISASLGSGSSDSQLVTAKAVWDAITTGGNSTLDNLGDVTISSGSGGTLADANILVYDAGAEQWYNQALSGDLTIDNTGEVTLTDLLGSAAGQYGSATAVPIITVDGKGRITAIETAAIATTLTINGDAQSSGGSITTADLNILDNGVTFSGGDGITTEVTIASSGEVDVNIRIDDSVATSADKLDFFSATTSAELAGVISDETGYSSGANLVFNISPTIDTSVVAGTASMDIFNTVATTVNAFGAATTLSIGGGSGNTTVNNNLIVSGNLTVSGSTTQVNTVVTSLTDPVIQLATNAIAGGDANDRGVSFNFGEGGVVKTGFFGMDMQSKRFVFQKAVGSGSGTPGTGHTGNEFFSPWGDAEFNGVYATVSEIGNIKLAGTGTLGTITTTAGDLTIKSYTGEVVFGVPGSGGIDANVTVTGDLDVSGTVTLANPLAVTSGGTGLDVLTSNAVVFTTTATTGVPSALTFLTGTWAQVIQYGEDGVPFASSTIDGGTY